MNPGYKLLPGGTTLNPSVETLADRLSRDGPLNELDAVGWAIRLAKKIEALHSLGVVHGSISPECVIATSTDRRSKAILCDLRHTPSRLAYQCPERAAGGDISPSDDVWAIAVTLYELLTGSSPFNAAADDQIRQRIMTAAPAPLAVFDVGDDDLQRIFDAAFQRDLASRIINAASLRRALEEWHPDRSVRTLQPLDEEDTTTDDEIRTVLRMPNEAERDVQAAPSYGWQDHGTPSAGYGQPGAMQSSDDDDDDDDDQVATRMKEYPIQPVYDGGVLMNPGASRQFGGAAIRPAAGVRPAAGMRPGMQPPVDTRQPQFGVAPQPHFQPTVGWSAERVTSTEAFEPPTMPGRPQPGVEKPFEPPTVPGGPKPQVEQAYGSRTPQPRVAQPPHQAAQPYGQRVPSRPPQQTAQPYGQRVPSRPPPQMEQPYQQRVPSRPPPQMEQPYQQRVPSKPPPQVVQAYEPPTAPHRTQPHSVQSFSAPASVSRGGQPLVVQKQPEEDDIETVSREASPEPGPLPIAPTAVATPGGRSTGSRPAATVTDSSNRPLQPGGSIPRFQPTAVGAPSPFALPATKTGSTVALDRSGPVPSFPDPHAGSLLGPSPVANFKQSRPGLRPTALGSPFAQDPGQRANAPLPSPYVLPESTLIDADQAAKASRRGILIATIVVVVLAAVVAYFLLGYTPQGAATTAPRGVSTLIKA